MPTGTVRKICLYAAAVSSGYNIEKWSMVYFRVVDLNRVQLGKAENIISVMRSCIQSDGSGLCQGEPQDKSALRNVCKILNTLSTMGAQRRNDKVLNLIFKSN